MKTIFITLLTLAMTFSAFAETTGLKCSSGNFPSNLGSTIDLSVSSDGNPVHATMSLNDPNPKIGNLNTTGEFRALAPTYNENQTEVNYFIWYAGAGFGTEGSHMSELIPSHFVIYAFKSNFDHSHSLFVGMINWEKGQKIETHFNYKCI